MGERLDLEDWERVLNALSLFLHNPQYVVTHEKVQRVVSELNGERGQTLS